MLKNFEEAQRIRVLIESVNCRSKKISHKQKKLLDFCDVITDIYMNKKVNNSIVSWTPIKDYRLLILEKKYFQILNEQLNHNNDRVCELAEEIIATNKSEIYYVRYAKKILDELNSNES